MSSPRSPASARISPSGPSRFFLNIVSQSLKWRNVEDFPVRWSSEISRQRLAHQAVNASQKCSEGLAGSGGGGDERGPPREEMWWPSLLLRLRWSTEFTDKPLRDERMRPCQRIRRGLHQNILARISIFRQPFARTTPARPARRRNLPASSEPSRKSGLKQWKMSARPRRLHAQSAGKMEKRRLFWGAHSNRAVQRPPSFLLSS